MTLTRPGRGIVRPILLVILGTLIGAAFVGPVSAQASRVKSEPASTYTRSASCSGLNFHPIDSITAYDYSGSEIFRNDTNGSGFFLCDPALPNKAVVTKVQFTVLENSGFEVRFCALIRSGLTVSSAATIDVMAQVPSTTASGDPGIVRLTTSVISHASVDATHYVYSLQCQLTGPTTNLAHQNLGIYGADVIYTISAANG
jgi:hypothetical protein